MTTADTKYLVGRGPLHSAGPYTASPSVFRSVDVSEAIVVDKLRVDAVYHQRTAGQSDFVR